MSKETEWGFPKGSVAQALRQILNRQLTSQDVEAVNVVLFGHLLVDSRLNEVVHYLLTTDLPRGSVIAEPKGQMKETSDEEMLDQVWQRISRTSFMRKMEYLEPCLKRQFPSLPARIRAINDARNAVMHGKNFKGIMFEGKSIWSEKGIQAYFLACQFSSEELTKLIELVDAPHARAEKWAKRLKELGEPLV